MGRLRVDSDDVFTIDEHPGTGEVVLVPAGVYRKGHVYRFEPTTLPDKTVARRKVD